MFYKIVEKKINVLFFLILFFGIFFRIYNISWGAPYYFHPDERNIASSISQLSYNQNLNPRFFAYGSLPIYSTYFTGVLVNFFENLISGSSLNIRTVSFENAILTGRVISVFLSFFLLYLIYVVGKELGGKDVGTVSLLLASLSVGFIQYAHFATFEIWLSFFTLLLCHMIIKYVLTQRYKYFIYASIVLGVLISIKISSVVFLPLCILILIASDLFRLKKVKKANFIAVEKILLRITVLTSITISMVNITSPYFWIDNKAFISSIQYESSVAIGQLKVFYSWGFENTTPILYQAIKVYPFILNPIVALISVISLYYICYSIYKKRDVKILIVFLFLLVAYLSQAFLFVKWTRYYIPTLSFIYIIVGFFIVKFVQTNKNKLNRNSFGALLILLSISFIFAFSYFKTVTYSPDTRVAASLWAKKAIPANSKILSEVYDMGIVPFNQYFSKIKLFNFYELENDSILVKNLDNELATSQYIINPSQRIIESRTSNPSLFPKGYLHYRKLINEIGYKKVYSTPCDIFCKIIYLGNPLNRYEQTVSVFDRPQVLIYKKSS